MTTSNEPGVSTTGSEKLSQEEQAKKDAESPRSEFRDAQSSQTEESGVKPLNTDDQNDTGDAREAVRTDLEGEPVASDIRYRDLTVVGDGNDFDEVRHSPEFAEVAAQNPALLFAQTAQLDTTTAGLGNNTDVLVGVTNGIEVQGAIIDGDVPRIPEDENSRPTVPYVELDNQTGQGVRIDPDDDLDPEDRRKDSDSALQPQARAFGDSKTPTPVVPSSDIGQSQPEPSLNSVGANSQTNYSDKGTTPGGNAGGNNQTLADLSGSDRDHAGYEPGGLTEDRSAQVLDPTAAQSQVAQLDTSDTGGNSTADEVLVNDPTDRTALVVDGNTGEAVVDNPTEDGTAKADGTTIETSNEPTLYRYTGDKAESIDSGAWPDSGKVDSDGNKLYTFSGDKAAGDSKGASDLWVPTKAADEKPVESKTSTTPAKKTPAKKTAGSTTKSDPTSIGTSQ